MYRILYIVLTTLLLSGCGKKGPLMPPEALAPAAISDLRVAQKGELFQLSWSRPAREAGGGALRDLAGFQLFRREVLTQAEDCEACPDAYRLLKAVDPEYLQEVRRVGDRVDVGERALVSEDREIPVLPLLFPLAFPEGARGNTARGSERQDDGGGNAPSARKAAGRWAVSCRRHANPSIPRLTGAGPECVG